MKHHAYGLEGDREMCIARVRAYAKSELEIHTENHPDFTVLSYDLFSVDDARALVRVAAFGAIQGDNKVLVVCASRLFSQAQNALLKLFEEPVHGLTLFLIVPSFGMLLPTLRSRMVPLIADPGAHTLAKDFLQLSTDARQKYIAKLLDRSKDEKDTVKQAARSEALTLVEGITRAVYLHKADTKGSGDRARLLQELTTFMPIMHDASTPLKPIFEHLLIVLPADSTVLI